MNTLPPHYSLNPPNFILIHTFCVCMFNSFVADQPVNGTTILHIATENSFVFEAPCICGSIRHDADVVVLVYFSNCFFLKHLSKDRHHLTTSFVVCISGRYLQAILFFIAR